MMTTLLSLVALMTAVFMFFKSPRISSRLFGNIDLSRFFKTEDRKTYFKDLYFFNKNIKSVTKGPLFLVVGKDSNALYELMVSGQQSKDPFRASFAQSLDPFAVLETPEAQFLFVNKSLFEKDIKSNFTYKSRMRSLIKWICKARGRKYIEGFVFVPQRSAFNPIDQVSSEIAEEISFFSTIYNIFYSNYKVRFPLFFLDHDLSIDQKLNIQNIFKESNAYETLFLGYSCDFENKPPTLPYSDYLKRSYAEFQDVFDRKSKDLINSKSDNSNGLSIISAKYSVKNSLFNLFKNYFFYFFEPFDDASESGPGAVTVINTSVFADPIPTPLSTCLKNAFNYIGASGKNMILVSQELLYSRKRLNIIMTSVCVALIALFSVSIYNSYQFLENIKHNFISFSDKLKGLDSSLQSAMALNTKDPQLYDTIQEQSCSLVRNFALVKNIPFKTPYLFPSWFSSLSEDLQNKFRSTFSASFSSFLIFKYNKIIDSNLEYISNPKANLESVSNSFVQYVQFMDNYSNLYNKLTGSTRKDQDDALVTISKLVYGNTCSETMVSEGFLSHVDTEALNNLRSRYIGIKIKATQVFTQRSSDFFDAFLNRHPIYLGSNLIQSAVEDFSGYLDKLLNEPQFSVNQPDKISLMGYAFSNLVDAFQRLKASLNVSGNILTSPDALYGLNYTDTRLKISNSQLLDPSTKQEFNNKSQRTFESVSKNIAKLAENRGSRFAVLFLTGVQKGPSKDSGQSNVGIALNPIISELFDALSDINVMYQATVGKPSGFDDILAFGNDFITISKNLSKDALWSSDSLQSFLLKNTSFEKSYSKLKFSNYPTSFSSFVKNYVANFSRIYWNQALCTSIVKSKSFNSSFFDTPPEDISDDDIATGISKIDTLGLPASGYYLSQINTILKNQDVRDLSAALETVVGLQTDTVLKQMYHYFEMRGLFGMGYPGFGWWNGGSPLSYSIFGVASDEGLKAALDAHKSRLNDFYSAYISSFVDGISPFYNNNLRRAPFYFVRWKSIKDSFTDFKNSSYQNFVSFTVDTLTKYKTDDCSDTLLNFQEKPLNPDFFTSRQDDFTRFLYQRCRVIFMKVAVDSYNDFAQFFNQSLGNRFPFTAPGYFGGAADITYVQTGIKMFRNLMKGKIQFLAKENSEYKSRPELKEFVDNMTAVDRLLNLQPDKDGTITAIPKYNVFFRFRNERSEEVFANTIVNWGLQVGQKVYGSEYGSLLDTTFQWKYGDPVKITFSFPRDDTGFDFRETPNDDPYKYIFDNNVNFNMADNWALFKLILKYNKCQRVKRGSCPSFDTVKFMIPFGNRRTLVVFCGVKILENGHDLFPVFPYNAPYLKVPDNLPQN